MNAMDVADKLREMWENNENVMSRMLDIKCDIERNGEVSLKEKNGILDLAIEYYALSVDLRKILAEVMQ